MEHQCKCTKEKEIEKIQKSLHGNGRKGLIERMEVVETKLDNVQNSIDDIKSMMKWGMTVIIIPLLISTFNVLMKILPKLQAEVLSFLNIISVWLVIT